MMKNNSHHTCLREAGRYLANARETLHKAGRRDGFYLDQKYVKSACGIAYHAVLSAADAYLLKHNRPILKKKGERKYVEDYQGCIAKLDKKLLTYFNSAYQILHLNGYYDGQLDTKIIGRGFELASEIIHFAENR